MYKSVFKPVFNRKKKLDSSGRGSVDIYCYLEGKKKYIKTGIRIFPDQWRGKILDIRKAYQVNKMISSLEEFEMNCTETTGSFTLNDLEAYLRNDTGNFIKFLQEEIKTDLNCTPGTMRYRKLMCKKLSDAVGNVSFQGMKYDIIKRFDNSMSDLDVSTRQKHHQQLRKYLNIAAKKGLVKENPYKHFKIKRPARKLKKCLWWDDLDKIWELEIYKITLHKFIFSCYTGLRISDCTNLRWTDIRKGKIILHMQKTSQPVVVPLDILSERPLEILSGLDSSSVRVFPSISDQVVNRELKTIGMLAGIPFSLNFHVSRHTFCTLVAHKTGSMFDVMRYAGIYQVSTAMTYVNLAKLFD